MRRPAAWTVVLLAALVPAACSAAPDSPVGSPEASSPPAAVSTPSTPGTGQAAAGCPQGVRTGTVTLTEADHGSTVCVATGTTVEVYLHAKATGQLWSKPTPDRTILQPAVSGKGALPVGVTAGFYRAVEPGQTRITAQLAPCRGPKSGPACDAVQLFEVTLTVR